MHTLLLLATEAAEGGTAAPGGAFGALGQFLPLILIVAVFYFLLIRPQRNRQRAARQLIEQMQIGDRVVTIGGFHGTVGDISDDIVRLELAPGLVVTVTKSAVARVLSEPTLDAGEDDKDDGEYEDDDQPLAEDELEAYDAEEYAEDPDVDATDGDEKPKRQ